MNFARHRRCEPRVRVPTAESATRWLGHRCLVHAAQRPGDALPLAPAGHDANGDVVPIQTESTTILSDNRGGGLVADLRAVGGGGSTTAPAQRRVQHSRRPAVRRRRRRARHDRSYPLAAVVVRRPPAAQLPRACEPTTVITSTINKFLPGAPRGRRGVTARMDRLPNAELLHHAPTTMTYANGRAPSVQHATAWMP